VRHRTSGAAHTLCARCRWHRRRGLVEILASAGRCADRGGRIVRLVLLGGISRQNFLPLAPSRTSAVGMGARITTAPASDLLRGWTNPGHGSPEHRSAWTSAIRTPWHLRAALKHRFPMMPRRRCAARVALRGNAGWPERSNQQRKALTTSLSSQGQESCHLCRPRSDRGDLVLRCGLASCLHTQRARA
jgi:hypothetical protein